LTGRPATSVRTFLAANREKLGSSGTAGPAATAPADAPPTLARGMEKLRIVESPAPVREREGGGKPKKMVVIGGLGPEERSQINSFAPGLEIVTARDAASAAAAATNADILLGLTSTGGICEPEIIDRAKELRWIDSQSAGVERCV